jgi:hypothetical protein
MPENQGRLSPLTSSSGQHQEEPDNSVEYYVKASKEESEYVNSANNKKSLYCCTCKFFVASEEACTVVAGRIEDKAYCKLYIEGGEKMSDKGLDVNESITTDNSYVPNTSVEPDPQSELAMQKASVVGGPTYTEPAKLDGTGNYSTTANSTTDAPSAGETTEPDEVNKSDDNMQLCNCAGMSKCIGCACSGCQTCDGCDDSDGECCQGCSCEHAMSKADTCNCCTDCGSDCNGDCCNDCSMTTKAASKEDDEASEPAPDVEELEKSVDKSLWGNAFSPGIPRAAVNFMFKSE